MLRKAASATATPCSFIPSGVKKGAFNLACLANNHILDYGEIAALDTLKLLTENGIRYTGVGNNNIEASKPFIFSINNCRFAFLF